MVSIGSNIAALGAQRRLGRASTLLGESSERLSSGLRINRASDDAAGLSIALSLNASSRVFTQSIRNLNDAVSAASIAQSASTELMSVVTRIKELASQSANGTVSATQRRSLDNEARALTKEFNRIVYTTKFNGVSLVDDRTGEILIQSGDSRRNSGLSISGTNLGVGNKGAGSMSPVRTFRAGNGTTSNSTPSLTGDFDGDSYLDVITTDSTGSITLLRGNGDGTFKTGISYSSGSGIVFRSANDFNGDGISDLLVDVSSHEVQVWYGTSTGLGPRGPNVRLADSGMTSFGILAATGDVNGDGIGDIIGGIDDGSYNLEKKVFLGNGDGTFRVALSTDGYFGSDFGSDSLQVGDLNGDGKVDLVGILPGFGSTVVHLGNGNGSFLAGREYWAGNSAAAGSYRLTDLNQDGRIDLTLVDIDGTVATLLGNGDGTFRQGTSFNDGGYALTGSGMDVFDFNGDGKSDLLVWDSSSFSTVVFAGNGDGSFRAALTSFGGRGFVGIDVNEDGVKDIVSATAALNSGSINVYTTRVTSTSLLDEVDLATRQSSLRALRRIEGFQTALSSSLGRQGADQSRFETALRQIAVQRDSGIEALSRIQDADIADESARYTRASILQQVAASVMAQANLAPQIALRLLRG